jgi:hypothetical protein
MYCCGRSLAYKFISPIIHLLVLKYCIIIIIQIVPAPLGTVTFIYFSSIHCEDRAFLEVMTYIMEDSYKCIDAIIFYIEYGGTVKHVLSGISRVQNIFPQKPGFCLIKLYYNN